MDVYDTDEQTSPGTVLRGIPLSPGYGEGIAHVYRPGTTTALPRRQVEAAEAAAELERLAEAIHRATADLEEIQERVLAEIGEAESQIVAAHLALLCDRDFVSQIQRRIEADLVNAELALEREIDVMAGLLAEVESEYLRERTQDIYDVRNRVLRHLGHDPAEPLEQLPPGTVLVAKDLLPSDTLNLDRAHVVGLVLERGGPTSHAAILARSMGIPAVAGVAGVLDHLADGASLLVDGQGGEVIIDPSPSQVTRFTSAQRSYERDAADLAGAEWRTCETRDGHTVTLYANVGRPAEIAQLHRHHLEGIGLFRTEYLFIRSTEPPTLEHQRAVYRTVLDELGPCPVAIRTLDLGGDKRPRFRIPAFDRGTRLGMRGLRLSLHESTLFRLQVQAIMEAAQGRDAVSILLPMVLSAEDLRDAIALIDEVTGGSAHARPLPVGAMLETPSALFEIDEILEQADFLSVGTNDLVQFMMALERRTAESLREEAILQPAILRALAHAVQRAASHGKPLTVCGEAAGNPLIACLLVGLGVERLSMSPVRAARVRAAVRRHTLADLQALAARALAASTRHEVLALVREVVAD